VIKATIASIALSIETFDSQIAELYQLEATAEADLIETHEEIDDLRDRVLNLEIGSREANADADQFVPANQG
jgi:hypothetical protein